MSDNVLNFVRCQWCTSGNAADMGHWGKCPGAAERDKAAEARVAEMFAALNAPTESATADQLRRKLLECEEALRTTEACAEKAERERDALLSQIDSHLDLCGAAPMHTVTEDGTVMLVVQVDVWDVPEHFTLSEVDDGKSCAVCGEPFPCAVFDRLTVYYEGDDRPDDAVPLYRLVPIEAES